LCLASKTSLILSATRGLDPREQSKDALSFVQ
jgi:hypothetical protein